MPTRVQLKYNVLDSGWDTWADPQAVQEQYINNKQ